MKTAQLETKTEYIRDDADQFTHSIETFTNLYITAVAPQYTGEGVRRNHYWYKVTTGATNHIAFRTFDGLERFLQLTGLECEIPAFQSGQTVVVNGTYRRVSHMKRSDMPNGHQIPVLTNGEFVQGCKIIGADGIHEIHTTNPNATDKIVLDYWKSERVCD
jgi:hypothetical protein